MPAIHVNLIERSYDVLCDYNLLDNITALIEPLALSKTVAIISDSNVAPLYSEKIITPLQKAGYTVSLHTVPAGEASKSLTAAQSLCSEMTKAGHNRKSFVIALGGGVVGDLAGFVASIFYRGIPFIQIPTTIVSLVDSSVGGKTGVNLPEGKNLVGAFHQPRLVIADPATLNSLEGREYREGFAEAIKHAAIRDAEMIQEIANLDPSDKAPPAELIAKNISIKARVVEEDEQELSGTRALLNFGHTIGHGIEASVPYGELLHGEAISIGMVAALNLSEKHLNLPHEDSQQIIELLKKFNLPTSLPAHITTETILSKLKRDKKFSNGELHFVLLESLGKAVVYSELTIDDMKNAIDALRN